MSVAAPGGFNQFVDYMRWRRLIRISHTKVDDILPSSPRTLLEVTNNVKNIGGEALYALKLIVHDFSD
jgi:hypothetical protein